MWSFLNRTPGTAVFVECLWWARPCARLNALSHVIIMANFWSITLMPILQIRKLMFRVANVLSQGHVGSKGQRWDWKPGLSDCKTSELKVLLYTVSVLKKKKKKLIQISPLPLTDPYSCCSEPSNWGCQRVLRSHPNELAQLLFWNYIPCWAVGPLLSILMPVWDTRKLPWTKEAAAAEI